jgi:hypothetical protein
MYKRSLIFIALALVLGGKCTAVLASDTDDSHLGTGIHDVTDPELASMRGRYTVGDNTVLYFGVEMVSTFQTNNGQVVQGTLTVGMNFSKNPNNPQVSFVPTVTITTPDAPLPTASTVQSLVSRNVQSGGIANVGGLVQSVQIAGDNNATANVTSLNIQSGGNTPSVSTTSNASSNSSPSTSSTGNSSSTASVGFNGSMANTSSSTTIVAPSTSGSGNSVASNTSPGSTTNNGTSTPNGRTATVGGTSVSSTYTGDSAEVSTTVAGEGSTSQWIHTGSLGQTIALTTDNAVVTNQMIVSLVTQQLGSTAQLAHTLAQSLNLSHLNGH